MTKFSLNDSFPYYNIVISREFLPPLFCFRLFVEGIPRYRYPEHIRTHNYVGTSIFCQKNERVARINSFMGLWL